MNKINKKKPQKFQNLGLKSMNMWKCMKNKRLKRIMKVLEMRGGTNQGMEAWFGILGWSR